MNEMSNAKILDDTVLASLFELTGSDELIREVATLFVQSAPELLSTFDRAYQDGDTKIMAAIAHRFKGSAGNIGAIRLYKIAENLENKLRSADAPIIDAQASQELKSSYEETAQELERRRLL